MGSPRKIDVQAIENYLALSQKFEGWPSFHDSEIHSLLLDRNGPDGPYIEMRIHVFTTKPDVDSEGRYIFDKQAIVTMRFSHVESEEITGFNEQNVIFDLDMRIGEDAIEVEISSSYGCAASFMCEHIAIKSVEDFADPNRGQPPIK